MELLIVPIAVLLFVIFSSFEISKEHQDRVGTTKDDKVLLNKQLETELARKINNPENKEHILELIKDDLVYVYGDDWEKHFNQRWEMRENCIYSGFTSPATIAHMLLLSKSGVICNCLNFHDLKLCNHSHANAYQCLRIMQCVEKNVREKRNDPKLKLYFYPDFDYEGTGKKRKAVPDYKYLHRGRFRWNFELDYNSVQNAKSLDNSMLVKRCMEIADPDFEKKNNPYKDTFVL